MRLIPIIALAALAACANTDEQMFAEVGIPQSVLDRLPAGVSTDAVGMQDSCYIYDDAGGNPVFVTDDQGRRICVN